MVIAKQGVHLAGLHQFDETKLDGFVPDPGEECLELMIIEPLSSTALILTDRKPALRAASSPPSPPPACSRR
jgi:hypothetical protein